MEEGMLTRTFGDYPLVRVLDFLLYSRDFDYPVTEIAKNAGVNFQTLKKLWPKLERDKIIISPRKMGGIQLYKINTGNPVIKKLIELNSFLCWEHAEHDAKRKQKVAA
ncbi:MAG TPA: hypothetical protein VJC16_07915 [Candidatus Nanoarchaeia archaeon]|nr:hypothetical protein [Candidatus Nanoarchaeia archaeon]